MKLKKFLKDIIEKYITENDLKELVVVIYGNEDFCYKNVNNFFSISLGALSQKDKIDEMADVFDCIDDNELFVLDPEEYGEEAQLIIDYLNSIGISDIGYEDENNMYNDDMEYIGKGPSGLLEIVDLLTDIIVEIWKEQELEIPVLFLDYEGTWYLEESTKKINNLIGTNSEYMRIYD